MLTRRESLGIIAAASACSILGRPAMADGEKLEIIDCHTHFYDPTRPEGVPWPNKESELYRKVMPADLRALKQFRPVTGTVIVEASSWLKDNDWLLDISVNDPFIKGIVGNVDLKSDDFAREIKRLSKNELFRGIRASVQTVLELIERRDWRNLELMQELDLELDVNGGPETPQAVGRLAKNLKGLRIVLNHIGNVEITKEKPPEAWSDGIREAAPFSNVYCKISALVEGAGRGGKKPPTDIEFYRPYIDVVWNAFGDDRVIYGSNWPVSDLAANYETLQRIVMEYAAERGEEAVRKFCSLNAKHAYKWIARS